MVIGWVVMFFLLGHLAFGLTFYQLHSDMIRQGRIVGEGHLGPVHGKSQNSFRKFQTLRVFQTFRLLQSSEIFRLLVLTNFPFPSILLKAQEYFGCGWWFVKPGFTCFFIG